MGLFPRQKARSSSAKPIVLGEGELVKAVGVEKRFGELSVLRGMDCSIRRGEVVVVIGPSGAGKSTFLRCINGLETIQGGEINVAGLALSDPRTIQRVRARVGMVFQRFNLFTHRTAIENVIEGPVYVRGVKRKEALLEGMALLTKVGLAHKANSYPSRLSGGEQQRVAIARALAMNPELMLFDEPTSSLDPELVGEVLAVMRKLSEEGMTMIVVTHQMQFARDVADRIVFMEDGRIIEDGRPEALFAAPQSPRTRTFMTRLGEG
jgi:ABC-type polar amino acid transport system ATPase subunit